MVKRPDPKCEHYRMTVLKLRMCETVLTLNYVTSWFGTLLNTTINLLLLVSQCMVVSLFVRGNCRC